jgi:hypothetical protein
MSSELESALKALKEFKNVTKKSAETTAKAVGFVWYDLISPRLISILIFLYLIFFSGEVLGNTISSGIGATESLLNLVLSDELVQLFLAIITFNVYVILLFFIFLSKESRDQSMQKLFYLTIIVMFISVVYVNYSLNNQDKEGVELFGQALEDSGENSLSLWDNIKCDTYGRLVRDPKCIEIQNTQVAEVASTIKIKDISNEEQINKDRLYSEDDAIEIVYDIDASDNTIITIEHIKCFTDKSNELFYQENLSIKIIGSEKFDFDCKDVGKSFSSEKETLDISTEIYYSIEQKFQYVVPVVNCQTNEIQNLIKTENRECHRLNENLLKELIPSGSKINLDSKDSIKTSDGLEITVTSFKNDLPVYVGDGKSETRNFNMLFKENRDLGNVILFEFVDEPKYPKSLLLKDVDVSGRYVNEFIKNDELLNIEIQFEENDNALEENPNYINNELIEFSANVLFVKTIKSGYQDIEFIKNYDTNSTTN